jgi:hypothetical protein
MSIESACFLDHSSNIVMVVIGYATIIPITLCLVAAWMDAKESKQEERTRLL